MCVVRGVEPGGIGNGIEHVVHQADERANAALGRVVATRDEEVSARRTRFKLCSISGFKSCNISGFEVLQSRGRQAGGLETPEEEPGEVLEGNHVG